jgi:hypothetical protein
MAAAVGSSGSRRILIKPSRRIRKTIGNSRTVHSAAKGVNDPK